MPVADSELLLYQAESVSLGGVMSAVEVLDGSEKSVHPNFSQAQRLAGAFSDAKLFFKIADTENGSLGSVKVYLDQVTPGDTNVKIYAGDQTDLVADHPAPRLFGVGQVLAPAGVLPTATVFDVLAEADAADIFQASDTLRLKDDNGYEFLEIASVSVVGNTATVTLVNPVVSTYTLAANPICSSCIVAPADVKTSSDTYTVTSAGGTLDDANNPVLLDNIGSVEETWTLAFSSATAYSVTGARLGAVGAGNSTVDSAITNPDFARDYMTIPFALFTGSYLSGDTVTFKTHPASVGFFSRYEAPSGTATLLVDSTTYCMFGE